MNEEGLDGKWFLKSVNSQGPTTDAFNVIGWPVPGSDRRLTPNTTLEFRTEEWPGCQDESRLYSGTVIGRYLAYRQSAPSQNSYTGRFEYLHTSGHITLYAFGLGLEGKRDGWISIYGLAPYTSDADRLAFAKEE
ncbi:MAG: hypothetical protein FIB01_10355 [Gemmatimonadetes bacterium]|nr:hypothetical protein [Gemmatimonadota bacterium]